MEGPGDVEGGEGGEGWRVGPAVQEEGAGLDTRVWLYTALVQQGQEDRREGEESLLQETVRLLQLS